MKEKLINQVRWDLGLGKLLPEWRHFFTTDGLKQDTRAGVTVAAIAIPMTLAIALASGVPPFAGLISAIVAGIVCGLFGGTRFAVSGPAAAMSVLIASIVEQYGFGSLMVVGVVCGVMQLLSGVLGLGELMRFVPIPVVRGFTSGMGALILIGQLPRVFGLPAPEESHVLDVFSHLGEYLHQTKPAALGLSLGTLVTLLLLSKRFPRFPVPFFATLGFSALAFLLGLDVELIGEIPRSISLPGWSQLPKEGIGPLLVQGVMVYTLASLETLLSSGATDKLSGRRNHPSQELIGQGLGNIFVALFGGIPISGVITRSSLNVRMGAKTRRSVLIQSLALLATLALFAPWIGRIPVAVLAGVLIWISFRLLNPLQILELWRISRIEAGVFAATFGLIVFVDLLAGIQIGLVCALLLVTVRVGRSQAHLYLPSEDGPYRVALDGPLTFMSSGKIASLRDTLEKVRLERGVVLDLSGVSAIDASGAGQLVDLTAMLIKRGAQIVLKSPTEECKAMLSRADKNGFIAQLFAVAESDIQMNLHGAFEESPRDRLVYGVSRFQRDLRPRYEELFSKLADGQAPHTLFITCSDSRINPNLITSTDPGELFIVRNVGNLVPPFGVDAIPAEGAAIEFAVEVLGVKEIVVCGHSGCGAMKAVVTGSVPEGLPSLKRWLSEAERFRTSLPKDIAPDEAARLNARHQIDHLKTYPSLRERVSSGAVNLHAWFYDIGAGRIEEWDNEEDRFKSLR